MKTLSEGDMGSNHGQISIVKAAADDLGICIDHIKNLDYNDLRLRHMVSTNPDSAARRLSGAWDRLVVQDSGNFALLAIEKNEESKKSCVGFMEAWIGNDGIAEVGVSVLQSARGKGLCGTLMSMAIDRVSRAGGRGLSISVLPENKAMIHAARRLGMAMKMDDGYISGEIILENPSRECMTGNVELAAA